MHLNRIRSFASLAAAFLLSLSAAAQTAVRYESQPGSKVKIDGTSTVHDWTVEGQIIGGFFEVTGAFAQDPKDLSVKPKVEVSIPVRSLKSGKRPMDNVMYDAMKMAAHPKIEYALGAMKLVEAAKDASSPWTFSTSGHLTVAGVKKAIEMPVKMFRTDKEHLKFTGEAKVKMTDFGITPPAPAVALGLIKTGDDVKVSFEWVTAPGAAAK